MILGPAFRMQNQVGDAGVLPTNPPQKERMRPLAIRWCWTLLELLLQALSPNNVALACLQLFFHSAAAPQASLIASLPLCGKSNAVGSNRMQCNALSIKGTSAWPAGLKCFFMVAKTPALSFLPSLPSCPPLPSSFLPSFLLSFPPSLPPSFFHSLLPILPSFLPSLLPSFLPSLPPSLPPSFLPSFLPSLPPSLLPSFLPSFNWKNIKNLAPSAVKLTCSFHSMTMRKCVRESHAYFTLAISVRPFHVSSYWLWPKLAMHRAHILRKVVD